MRRLFVLVFLLGCSSSSPAKEPREPIEPIPVPDDSPRPQPKKTGPQARRGDLTLMTSLGKLDNDYLIAMLRADRDFSDIEAFETRHGFAYTFRYVGRNLRASIEDAAERAAIACSVRVDGKSVNVD